MRVVKSTLFIFFNNNVLNEQSHEFKTGWFMMTSGLWLSSVELTKLIGCDICLTEIPASDWSVMRRRLDSGGVYLWQTTGVLHREGGAPAIRGVCASYYYTCVWVFCCCISVTMYDWHWLYHSVIKLQPAAYKKFCLNVEGLERSWVFYDIKYQYKNIKYNE